jgi:hypothetical protein
MNIKMLVNEEEVAEIDGLKLAEFSREHSKQISGVVTMKLGKYASKKEIRQALIDCSLSFYASSVLGIEVKSKDNIKFIGY